MIKVEGLTKTIKGRTILDNINCTFENGTKIPVCCHSTTHLLI